MKKSYDKPLIAVLIGMLVMIPLELYTQTFKFLGLNQISTLELTSLMMVKEGSWRLGLLTGAGTGGLATLLIYQSARLLGKDYLYLKGAGIGMVTYAFIDILFGTLGGNSNLEQMTVVNHLVHAIGAGFAGALAGFLVQKYLFAGHEVIDEHQGFKPHRYKVIPEPARKREDSVRFIKPRKIGNRRTKE